MSAKVALVIGGTGGLGAASAEDLGKDHTVIVAGRNKSKGEAIVGKIVEAGGKAAFLTVDVADQASIMSLHKTVVDTYGRLDVALNAGGVISAFAKVADASAEDYDRVMDVNVKGTFLCMQEQIKAMLKNAGKTGGSIVNYSSVYGKAGAKWGAIYSTSKHAIIGLTRAAALDYAQDNIRINAVAPGIIPTEMTAALDPNTLPDGEMKDDFIAIFKSYPQGRLGEATDCSRAVRYLVESPWSTGAVLDVDGGFGAQ